MSQAAFETANLAGRSKSELDYVMAELIAGLKNQTDKQNNSAYSVGETSQPTINYGRRILNFLQSTSGHELTVFGKPCLKYTRSVDVKAGAVSKLYIPISASYLGIDGHFSDKMPNSSTELYFKTSEGNNNTGYYESGMAYAVEKINKIIFSAPNEPERQ